MEAPPRWLAAYGEVPHHLAYPECSLYDAIMATVRRVPEAVAYDFLGATATYREFGRLIDQVADGLASLGMGPGDRIAIALPTSPQAVIAFYAANRLGAIGAMVHPLSTAQEVERLVSLSRSRFALTLDALYDRFRDALGRTPLETLILTRISDALTPLRQLAFRLLHGRKIPAVPRDAPVRWWKDLVARSYPPAPRRALDTNAMAGILFSGGTLGTPKGIMLSHRNFIADAMQLAAWVRLQDGDRILAALPLFHGFGLGALANAGFVTGCRVILVPRSTAQIAAKLLRQKRPNMIAGVPTMYEAMSRDPNFRRADLTCLKAAFSGGDALPASVKERFERAVAAQGGSVKLLEGYGLTEAVTGVTVMPLHAVREGSVGLPLPDMLVSICRPGTDEELPVGEDGEICVHGPPVMLGYLDDPSATAESLKRHRDGRTWLHTGDIGHRDADGFFYFRGRLKRMIKSSGFNVYPMEVEQVIGRHPAVAEACVVGVPDLSQGERVKAFVVLRAGQAPSPALAQEIIAHCRDRLIKWSCPRDVEFRSEFPHTRLGKVDCRALARGDPVAAGH
ncbi:MAG: AMP-binding protein [Deltaproteobacteria bacterium]